MSIKAVGIDLGHGEFWGKSRLTTDAGIEILAIYRSMMARIDRHV